MNARKVTVNNKEGKKFLELMYSRGYRSVNQFSKACGIDTPNVSTNIKGTFKVSIARCFIYANALGVPVQDVIDIFYSKEIKENEAAIKKFDPEKIK